MGLGKEQGSQPLLLNPQLESGGGGAAGAAGPGSCSHHCSAACLGLRPPTGTWQGRGGQGHGVEGGSTRQGSGKPGLDSHSVMNWTDPFPSPGLSFLFWNTEEEWLGEAPGALTVPRVLYVPLTLGARPRFLGSPWLSTGDVSLRALTCLCVSREGRCPLSHPRCQT